MLVLDPNGRERWRVEGYLPKEEFRAQLELGLARVAFMQKQWVEAQRRYAAILERHPESKAAPEALYWRGASRYSATHDHTALDELRGEFERKYPDSAWALRTAAWSR